MLKWIKRWFEKELEEIVAPLDKIKNNITNYVAKQEAKIEADANRVKSLLDINAKRVESNIKANKVIKNLETLLGIN